MQDNFSNKEYGEYFASLEKNINRKPNSHIIEHKKSEAFVTLRLARFLIIPIVLLVLLFCIFIFKKSNNSKNTTARIVNKTSSIKTVQKKETELFAKTTDSTITLGDEIKSEAVVFINGKENTVIAQKNMSKKMYPASTTKIMTLLVAVDNIKNYKDTFTMSYSITDPLYKAEASVAGFSSGEKVNMTDLLYGTILPSGADAAMGLAVKIAGSEKSFVELMNDKAKDLGLKNTHFTNCTGLFDRDHYTTAEDLAAIVRAALNNKTCKQVLSTYKYTTKSTPQHPDGLLLENTLFKYMYGTEPEGATILGGKTGYVLESGYCVATFGEDDTKTPYVCVSLSGNSRWPVVYDLIDLYSNYTK